MKRVEFSQSVRLFAKTWEEFEKFGVKGGCPTQKTWIFKVVFDSFLQSEYTILTFSGETQLLLPPMTSTVKLFAGTFANF